MIEFCVKNDLQYKLQILLGINIKLWVSIKSNLFLEIFKDNLVKTK